jgi:hypothetical protein
MRRRPLLAAAAALALFATVVQAQTTEVAGVRFESSLPLAGTRLQLNGAGVRYKAVFKVYAAGLYLAAPAASTEAVLAGAGPRRLHLVMLRDIDANELGKLFVKGIEQNSAREDFVKTIPGTLRMGEIFATRARLAAGESITLDWIPGTGTVVAVNGKPVGEPIREREFNDALLRIWLGSAPADRLLKDALLGRGTRGASNG